jgi:hypothetical protein
MLKDHGLLTKPAAFSNDNMNTKFGGNSRSGNKNLPFFQMRLKKNITITADEIVFSFSRSNLPMILMHILHKHSGNRN